MPSETNGRESAQEVSRLGTAALAARLPGASPWMPRREMEELLGRGPAALVPLLDVARTLRGGAVLTGALALASVVTLQAALGIATLLHQAPLALALLHQAMALAALAVAVIHAERLVRAPAGAGEATRAAPMHHGEPAT